ncbi:MAG: hypothetical protein RL417_1198, partial [Pseudomonadota bacterium]
MKTMLIKLPRTVTDQTTAIYETKWGTTPVAVFEQLLEEFHDSIKSPFSLEIFSTQQLVSMCFTSPDETSLEILVSAVYSMAPNAEIVEIDDYTHHIDERSKVATTELKLIKNDIYPFQTWATLKFGSLSPLAGVLSQLPTEDRIVFQVVCQRIKDSAGFHAKLNAARSWDRIATFFRPKYWFKREVLKAMRESIAKKCQRKMYCVTVRIAAIIPPEVSSEAVDDSSDTSVRRDPGDHLRAIVGAVAFVNTPDDNGIKMTGIRRGMSAMKPLRKRSFGTTIALITPEIATFWHPPKLSSLPNTHPVLAVKGPPPSNLPKDRGDPSVSFFGKTDFREHFVPFGIHREDRRRHMYVVGKSGTGKSCLLQLLIQNDIERGYGAAVLDPHGDLVDNILRTIPEKRLKDVVLFDPTDVNFPPS